MRSTAGILPQRAQRHAAVRREKMGALNFLRLCVSLHSSALSAVKILLILFVGAFYCATFAQKATESPVKTLSPAEGDREAKELIAQILSQQPEQTFTNALLKIRGRESDERKVQVRFQTVVTPTNWFATYEAEGSPAQGVRPAINKLTIIHSPSGRNQYQVSAPGNSGIKTIPPEQTAVSFANSDFSVADLGLEFLHWPNQKVIKKEMYNSRYCAVLESTNPNASKDGYARVRSWITTEPPLAPVRAEAYNAAGKRIKVFDVKGVEKVNGHFQVDSVEMRNLQTGSRTVMEFDLQ
jgi:hypothetical protein